MHYYCTECGDIVPDEWVDKYCDLEDVSTTGIIYCASCRKKDEQLNRGRYDD